MRKKYKEASEEQISARIFSLLLDFVFIFPATCSTLYQNYTRRMNVSQIIGLITLPFENNSHIHALRKVRTCNSSSSVVIIEFNNFIDIADVMSMKAQAYHSRVS